MVMETTFLELRCKEVINLADGKRLGRVMDIVIDLKCGRVCGIVVPGERGISLFKRAEELYIPWCDICKIGDDVIIVDLKMACPPGNPPPRPRPPHRPDNNRPPRYIMTESYRGADGEEGEVDGAELRARGDGDNEE